MKLLIAMTTLFAATAAFAQTPPAANSPEVQQVMSQLTQVGCQAEAMTSAQTIVGMQKQITDLQNQLKAAKADPPPKKK